MFRGRTGGVEIRPRWWGGKPRFPAHGRSARGKHRAGQRLGTGDGEDADAPQTGLGVFSWLATQTVHTPQSSALKKGHLMEGLKGHREVRKVRAEVTSVPAAFCPGTHHVRAE